MHYSNEELLTMYKRMVLSRVYEEVALEYLKKGVLENGCWHLAAGEEAAQIGCVSALGPNDYYVPTHRSHGVLTALLDLKKFTAESICKTTGYARGKASIVHIGDLDSGVINANGILAAGMPIAVGFAKAQQKLGKDSVVVSVIGDGASAEGSFYEAMNMAGVMNAPIVFFIENNGMGWSNPISNATCAKDLSQKGAGVGIPGVTVDGMDILAVREAMDAAIELARRGQPSVIEAKTCRYYDHSIGGIHEAWRDAEELEAAHKNDPIEKYEKVLNEMGILNEELKKEIYEDARNASVEAFDFAVASPAPDEEMTCDISAVYADVLDNL